jgi:hypothetical protein
LLAVCRYALALRAAEQGDAAHAHAEFQAIYEARIRALGPEHPETLAVREHLT